MTEGMIIAVVGGPRSGKSFLTKKLAEYYRGTAFLEEDLPDRIKEDLATNTRHLERHLWFRNKMVQIYLEALELKRKGEIVILDNFWITYHLYVDENTIGFEKEVVDKLVELDKQMFAWPDVVILLCNSEKGIRDFVKKGGREFDSSEEYMQKVILPITNVQQDYFKGYQGVENVVVIDRDDLDFKEDCHFDVVLGKIACPI